MVLSVNMNDARGDHIALFDHVAGVQEVALRQLGDVDQALQALLEAGEGPEADHVGDDALHDLAHVVALLHRAPGVGLQPPQAEAYPPPLPINVEDINLHLLAALEHVAGMGHPPPR